MRKHDFNTGWSFRPLGTDCELIPVTLPHDAMRTERRTDSSLGGGNIGWFDGGDYEYIRSFTVPEELKGQDLILEFEGVYRNAEVFVNGKLAASRPYGYTNFYVELNGLLDKMENEIRVVAKNSDQPNSRWYSGSGIYRPVWLYSGSGRYIRINGLKIKTLSLSPVRTELTVSVSGEGEIQLDIYDGDCPVTSLSSVSDKSGNAVFFPSIPNAKLWSPESPHLYRAEVRFGDDIVSEQFGIRTLSWTPDKGIALNGERVVLRGACIHHDNGILGACTYPEVEERRIRILKEAGYNAVRSAHNPASKYLLDACDSLGMLMVDEYVDCWYMHKTEFDYASYVEKWWREDLRDMVDKDFNHPSVIMYSTGNEVGESAQERGIKLQKDFTEYLHALDPTRPVTCGINIFFNFLSSVGLGVYSDEKAEKQAAAAKKEAERKKASVNSKKTKPKRKKAVGSEFFNIIAAKIGCDFMKFGATLPPCDTKTKDVFAAMDIAGYNYGNWRYRHDSRKYPNRLILGSETLIGDAYDFWEISKEIPQIVGDFVWAAWDYIGECGENSPEFPDYQTDAPEDRVRGGTCRIDMTGKMGTEVDYTRIAFELETGPRLSVLPVYEDGLPNMTGWQLTRGLRSWTYPGCDGRKAEITVFARCAYVEVFVNGKKIARRKMSGKCVAKIKAAYSSGEITALAYGQDGKEIGRDSLKTAGEATELRVEPEKKSGRPGEMLFFRVRYTDEKGEIKPMEKHTVTASALNGTVIGAANGCCSFRGNFAGSSTPTYFGEAQIIVQTSGAGPVILTVTDGERTVRTEVPCGLN